LFSSAFQLYSLSKQNSQTFPPFKIPERVWLAFFAGECNLMTAGSQSINNSGTKTLSTQKNTMFVLSLFAS